MASSYTRTFLGIQIVVWSTLMAASRFSWLNPDTVPSWGILLLYSTLGFAISSGLGFIFIKLVARPPLTQLLISLPITIAAAFLWSGLYNAISYHVLASADNSYAFWGYFHFGKQSVFQLLCWSGAFWMLHYYRQFYMQQKLTSQAQLNASSLSNHADRATSQPAIKATDRIVIKDGKSTRLIDARTIESIVSGKDYLCIKIGDDILIHRSTMKSFIEKLPPSFIRCHRSHTVNMDFIVGINSSHEQTHISTTSGDKHPVSRRYKSDVKARLAAFH